VCDKVDDEGNMGEAADLVEVVDDEGDGT